MSAYSATAVITPAIERTRQFLFRPFYLGRFLKLTLVAALTEGGMSSCNFHSGSSSSGDHTGGTGGLDHPFHLPLLHWQALALIGLIVGVALVAIPVLILIRYLLIRLRFSFFDCVLYGQDKIGPGWRKYHRQAVRFLGMSLCVTAALWLLWIPVGYEVYRHFRPLFDKMLSGGEFTFWDVLPLAGTVLPLMLAWALGAYLVDTTLGCFALPRIALEDASIGEALEDVWSDIQAEPGQFALFFLLRTLLAFAATIIACILLAIPLVIVALLGVAVGLLLKSISTTAMIALGIPALIVALILILAAVIGLSGTIGVFRRNYAILFYGGRYPELAAILWPPQAPATPAPLWQPGFPANPAEGA
jgi:hypothetical protein